MSEDETGVSRNSCGPPAVRCGEPTQRFSALQQQLLCAAIHFFHRHIRSDPDVLQRMEGNQMFRLFFEVSYHNNKPDLNRIFPDSVHDCSTLHVCSFILSILHQGIFSVSAFIVSVIYLSRFKESSHITLHACTWRPLFLTSLLLADKMWEDKPVRNSSLAKLFPVLSNSELNRMESEFLGEIRFNVLVKPDLFCSFCEKLLAEQVHQEITRCVNNSEYAATLQADHVETQPLKPQKQNPQQQQQQQQHKADTLSGTLSGSLPHQSHQQLLSENSVYDSQLPVAWMEASAPSTGTSSVAPLGYGDTGAVPRSQSAGPTTTGSGRANHVQQPGGARPQQPHTASQPLCSTGSGSAAGAGPSQQPVTHQPPRSVSVHLHRGELQKKHSIGKVEDPSDKPVPVRPGAGSHPAIQHGHLLRRSLPAKTSNSVYAPLARAPSTGVGGAPGFGREGLGAGVSAPLGLPGPIGSATPAAGGMQSLRGVYDITGSSSTSSVPGSGVGVGGTGLSCLSSLRQPMQSTPRSPTGVSPVSPVHLQQQQYHQHEQQQQQQQLLHPDRPTSQSQPLQPLLQRPSSQQSAQLRRANRAATPPAPMAAHGSGGITPGHSGGAPQGVRPGMAKLHSRGASPGVQTKLSGALASLSGASGGGAGTVQQPPRALSSPLGPSGPLGGATSGAGGMQSLQGVYDITGSSSMSSVSGSGVGGIGGTGLNCLSSLRQPMQTTPRSPSGVSPVSPVRLQQQQYHQHEEQQLLHPERPTSQSQPLQPLLQRPSSQQSAQLRQANCAATPPAPMAAHGSGGITPGHSGGAPQGVRPGMTKLHSRGASPGVQTKLSGTSGGGAGAVQQPPRAASAPRVSAAVDRHHNHATPPVGSTLRTASQPMQAPGNHPGRQHPGQHAPGSPSLTSPMVASAHTPAMPWNYGGGGSMGVNSGRGGVNMVSGMQRNASPMGVGMPASPVENTPLQPPFGQAPVVSTQRPELLSATRGRSPAPAAAGPNSGAPIMRAPRAVTPGALVKGIAQGMHGPGMSVTRSSLGPQVVQMHRTIG